MITQDAPDNAAIMDQMRHTIEAQQREIRLLKEQLNSLLHQRFGPKSEAFIPGQGRLFEAEAPPVSEAPPEVEPPTPRRKGGRRRPPQELPRVRVEHDLDEADKRCDCGAPLARIGEQISEQYDVVPPRFQVLEHVRFKYACPCCDQGLKLAPKAPDPLPQAQVSAGLLAWLGAGKFADALPLHRQGRILEQRFGVRFSRTTLAAWMIGAADKVLMPLLLLLESHLQACEYLHADETYFQVLDEPGKGAWQKSYLWARVSATGPPIVRLNYHWSRSGAVADALFKDFAGYLHTDGYPGYNGVAERETVTQLGCWAHARRKFDAAIKAAGQDSPQADLAREALGFIRQLYVIDRTVKGCAAEVIYAKRQEQSRPVLDELHIWMEAHLEQAAAHGGALAKAFTYLQNQWPKLVRFLEDGRLALDNNRVERHIRPIAVGRKNWLCVTRRRTHETDVRLAA